MAFAAARPDTDTMSEMNITPLVDVMLVLLVIFMVTAPMMDFRLGLRLPGPVPDTTPKLVERELTVEPGDMFRLDGESVTPQALRLELASWKQQEPDGVLRVAVSADADYQSAATAMAAARNAGIENIGLVEP